MSKLSHKGNQLHWYRADGSPQHDADLKVARKENLFPSVTSILKCWENPAIGNYRVEKAVEAAVALPKMEGESIEDYMQRVLEESWRPAEQAANDGKALHGEIEQWNQFKLDPEKNEPVQFSPEWERFCLPWVEYAEKNITQIISAERVLVSEELGVAGTTDLIAVHKDYGECVFDYKTTKVKPYKGKKKAMFWPTYVQQLAAYAEMYRLKTQFPDSPRIISIVIDLDEPGLYERVWERDEQEHGLDFFKKLVATWQSAKLYTPRRA